MGKGSREAIWIYTWNNVFRKEGDRFVYAGFSPDVIIDHSSDGVYRILSAFAEEKM